MRVYYGICLEYFFCVLKIIQNIFSAPAQYAEQKRALLIVNDKIKNYT